MPAQEERYRLIDPNLADSAPSGGACFDLEATSSDDNAAPVAPPPGRARRWCRSLPGKLCGMAAVGALAVAWARSGRTLGREEADIAGSVEEDVPLKLNDCLCTFDVDRTLTATHLDDQCPQAKEIESVREFSGHLHLSQLGQFMASTPCKGCHKGIISAAGVGGEDERNFIASQVGVALQWSTPGKMQSPLVRFCPEGQKAGCAKDIIAWLFKARNIIIKPRDVYHFDDLALNLKGFKEAGMNARQISCRTRDSAMGLCGGEVTEINFEKGVFYCPWLGATPAPKSTPASTRE